MTAFEEWVATTKKLCETAKDHQLRMGELHVHLDKTDKTLQAEMTTVRKGIRDGIEKQQETLESIQEVERKMEQHMETMMKKWGGTKRKYGRWDGVNRE